MKQKKMVLVSLILMALTVALPTSVFASYYQVSSFDCGGASFVQEKDSKLDVKSKCGEPVRTESNGDVWIYDLGPSGFVYYLRFVSGILERIERYAPAD